MTNHQCVRARIDILYDETSFPMLSLSTLLFPLNMFTIQAHIHRTGLLVDFQWHCREKPCLPTATLSVGYPIVILQAYKAPVISYAMGKAESDVCMPSRFDFAIAGYPRTKQRSLAKTSKSSKVSQVLASLFGRLQPTFTLQSRSLALFYLQAKQGCASYACRVLIL